MGYTRSHSAGVPGSGGVVREIVRRWPIVLVVALAAVAAGAIASSRQEDSYTADVRMVITPLAQHDESFLGTSLIRDSGDAARTASTLAETMDSQRVDVETAERVGDGWTAGAVHDAVVVKPVAEANLVEISAEAPSAAEASRLAMTFATSTVDVRWRTIAEQLEDRIAALDELPGATSDPGGLRRDRELLAATLRSGKDPTLSLQGNEPKVSAEGISTAIVIALALVGGLFLGGLAALAISRLGGRLRSEEDVLATYPLPVLARVLPASILRTAKVLPDLAWQGVFGGLAARITSAIPEGGTIMVTSPCEGDGRSSSATSLAAAISEGARSATLVELDLGPSATDDVAQVLAAARGRAGFVVVDGPPLGADPRVLKAAALADVVIIVVRIGHTDRQALRHARELLEGTGVKPAGLLLVEAAVEGVGPAPELGDGDLSVTAHGEALTLNR